MLTFYFTSLSFQPPLAQEKQLYFTIQLGDGSKQTTDSFTYIPEVNLATPHETLEFIIKEPERQSNFQIEVCEYSDKTPERGHMIGKETISLGKQLTNGSHELTLPTVYGTDAVVGLAVELSHGLGDPLSEDEAIEPEKHRHRYLDKFHKLNKYNPFKEVPLYNDFIVALSPLVLGQAMLVDFITWKNPQQTFWISILLTLGFLYGRFLIGVGFLLFFMFSRRLIPKAVALQPLEGLAKERKRDLYKRNFAFMKESSQHVVKIYAAYRKVIGDPNKTLLIQFLFILRRFSPALAVLFFTVRLRFLVIGAYWTLLIYNTRIGKDVILRSYNETTTFMNHFHYRTLPLIKYIHIVEDKIFGKYEPIKNVETNVAADVSRQYQPVSDVNVAPKTKPQRKMMETVYVTYENQRWWPKKGYGPELLPGERPSWSDETGKIELWRQDFKLPGPTWRWETEWTLIITPKTDTDGWEYASRFKKFADPDRKESFMNTVRRRKWIRKCAEYAD